MLLAVPARVRVAVAKSRFDSTTDVGDAQVPPSISPVA